MRKNKKIKVKNYIKKVTIKKKKKFMRNLGELHRTPIQFPRLESLTLWVT